jgi:hypothetical protein
MDANGESGTRVRPETPRQIDPNGPQLSIRGPDPKATPGVEIVAGIDRAVCGLDDPRSVEE